MKVRLYTSDGKGLVTEATIPPFNKAPDVISWGQRLFAKGDFAECGQDGVWLHRYTEAFTYAIPDVPHDVPSTVVS